MVCSCIPAKKHWIAARNAKPQTISVGNRSTSPVRRYSAALLALIAHHRPGPAGQLVRLVAGVIVVYINDRFGQGLPEIGHDLLDGLAFVVARD